MAGTRQTRRQLDRLLALSDHIKRRAHVTATSLAELLEVSAKTIYRDIRYLQESQGAPIEFNSERGTYVLKDQSWQLERLNLTEGELLELALAQRVAAQYAGTSLGDTLERLFEKVRQVLPTETRVDLSELRSEFSFHGQPARPIDRRIWKTLARAVRECRVVKATYWSRAREEETEPTLEPLHLANLEGDWYLAARWRPHDKPVHLAVSRFRAARLQTPTFERGGFDAEDFFSNRFGRFVGKSGEEIVATIRFKQEAAFDVLERVWHPEQEVKKHRGGSVTLTLPFPTEFLAVRWVLQWGSGVCGIEPPQLRRGVIREATGLMERAAGSD